MIDRPLRILLIGAHPDDADIKAGGTAAKWCALGHVVQLVSLTNGAAGHHVAHGASLAVRRRSEAQAGRGSHRRDLHDLRSTRWRAQRSAGVTSPGDSLYPIVSARPRDHAPLDRTIISDHRFAGLLVQDASYLLTVPAICPDVPHLASCPVILSFSDAFTKPCRFEPHVVVDIEDVFDRVVAMLHCHQSQFYEWLPYNGKFLDQVPRGRCGALRVAGSEFSRTHPAPCRPVSRSGHPHVWS